MERLLFRALRPCALFRAVAVCRGLLPSTLILYHKFSSPKKCGIFADRLDPDGLTPSTPLLYHKMQGVKNAYFSAVEYHIQTQYMVVRGSKNLQYIVVQKHGLWVVFPYTDCKKIGLKTTIKPPQKSPQYPNPYTPSKTHTAPKFPTQPHTNRKTNSQTQHYYVFPKYYPQKSLRISEIVYKTSKTLPKSVCPISCGQKLGFMAQIPNNPK